MAYNVGDIVQLKSGGPKMTVSNPNSGGRVQCHWFTGAKMEGGFFPSDTLIPVTEDKK